MAEKERDSLKPAAGGKFLFLRADTYEKIRAVLRFADLFPDPSQFTVSEVAGRKQFRYRAPQQAPATAAPGGASVAELGSLVPTTQRPPHLAPVSGSPGASSLRIWFTFGVINSLKGTNLTDKFDVSTAKDFYAEVNFTTTGAFAVTSWKIVEKATNFEPPAITSPRPDKGYFLLGSVFIVDSKPVLRSSGSGSIYVWPQISNSLSGSNVLSTLVWSRTS